MIFSTPGRALRRGAACGLLALAAYCGLRALAPGPESTLPLHGVSTADAATLTARFASNPKALKAFLNTAGPEQKASLLAKAAMATRNREVLPDLDLLELATDHGLCPTAADREDFLLAHAGHVALLRAADPSGTLVAEYVDDLKAAAKDPATWKAVRDDPVGLLLRTAVPNLPAEDLAFYEANKHWLEEILPAIGANPADPTAAPAEVVKDVLASCRKYHSLPMRAAAQFGPDGIVPFLVAGDAVKAALAQGVPFGELVEVVFAQAEFVRDDPNAAATLVALYKNEKEIWTAAKAMPRLLWLHRRLPARAAVLVKLFPHDDVPALLFYSYAEALEPTAEALERTPSDALDVLTRAAADPALLVPFKAALAAHGWRVVPYAEAFGLQEAAKVTPAWLDKAFDPAGTPRGKEWWTKVPLLGGPADLARSVRNGTVEAGEVGWAVLDVVDGALLVASLGGSAGLSAAKQAAKAGAKQGLKSAAKAGAGKAAVRAVAKPAGSFLTRVAGRTAGPAVAVGRYAVKPAARAAFTALRAFRRGVGSLSPAQAKLITRGLLAVGLGVTLRYRTVPAVAAWYERRLADLGPLLEAAGTTARRLVEAARLANEVAEGFANPPSVRWAVGAILATAAAWVAVRCGRRGTAVPRQ